MRPAPAAAGRAAGVSAGDGACRAPPDMGGYRRDESDAKDRGRASIPGPLPGGRLTGRCIKLW
ncbi:hypothetical protein GCM10027160_53890 [Streptomyces calidiresistens]